MSTSTKHELLSTNTTDPTDQPTNRQVSWTVVAAELGRTARACSDRWRTTAGEREDRHTGGWVGALLQKLDGDAIKH